MHKSFKWGIKLFTNVLSLFISKYIFYIIDIQKINFLNSIRYKISMIKEKYG